MMITFCESGPITTDGASSSWQLLKAWPVFVDDPSVVTRLLCLTDRLLGGAGRMAERVSSVFKCFARHSRHGSQGVVGQWGGADGAFREGA